MKRVTIFSIIYFLKFTIACLPPNEMTRVSKINDFTPVGIIIGSFNFVANYKNKVNCSIENEENSHFDIKEDCIDVILKKPLDNLTIKRYDINITFTNGIENCSGTLQVYIEDPLECEPKFTQSEYEFILPELSKFSLPLVLGKVEVYAFSDNDTIQYFLNGKYSSHFEVKEGYLMLKNVVNKTHEGEIFKVFFMNDKN
jgi:hypothetical protein